MRGKHAAAVAVRRDAHEQQAEVETYQRKIRDLLAELEAVRATSADSDQRHKREVAKLKAQVQEATSPALIVAHRENRTLREERDHAKNRLAEIQSLWDRQWKHLVDHGVEVHRMTGVEATEWAISLIGERIYLDTVEQSNIPTPGVLAIQRARGQRH